MAITFRGSATGPAILGNEQLTQPLFVLENQLGSRVNVNVRRLLLQLDATTALTSVMPLVKTSRAVNVSGGARVAESKFDTTQTHDPRVRLALAAGDAFPITATAGDTVWQQFLSRQHTAGEQNIAADGNALPSFVDTPGKNFVVRPGEAIICQVFAPNLTSNTLQMNNWTIQVVWEEDSVATYAISGQVTLSAVPVVGARVLVIEADDDLLTNPVIVGTQITDGSGNWSSSIKVGKIGAVFTQYKSGATLYTAPGRPFLQ